MLTRPRSLTSRLVVTAVALVALVSLLIGAATTVAMRSYLFSQLDDEIENASNRVALVDPTRFNPSDRRDPPIGRGPRQTNGSLFANDVTGELSGGVVTDDPSPSPLSDAVLDALDDIPADGQAHAVELPGLGNYRVAAATNADGITQLNGLPTSEVDDTVSSLIQVEALLTTLGVVLALGAGLVVVRRQLRPLREVAATAHTVAELPLAEGEIDLSERVPAHLTDERTEVGQVGSALNTLLAHVEDSLSARHRSEMQVRQFVADASHELRTPLATIAGYTELARRRPGDTEASTMALGKVEEESRRMTALVEDLLLLARLDAGRPLEREPVDLTRLLLEAVSDARVLSPGHHWRLDLPEEEVEVVGDEQRLHQVVTNLLTNARKYTPEGTTVTVSARPGGFAVHDDGPGFAPELVDHAFERFARGDASRHREGGAGLGLALVQAIVSAHGGTVSLTSTPGDTRIAVQLG
ncbi:MULTISPECIES: sensor histidine kinase [unclassified Nocardioides]|uniref:sensor histidine kinase n=1 Tax=unclassified Nocardioides TaxID=2615069 RepID=UPI0030150AA4